MNEKEYLLHFCKWLELNGYKGNDLECYVESFLNHFHEDHGLDDTIEKERERCAKILQEAAEWQDWNFEFSCARALEDAEEKIREGRQD